MGIHTHLPGSREVRENIKISRTYFFFYTQFLGTWADQTIVGLISKKQMKSVQNINISRLRYQKNIPSKGGDFLGIWGITLGRGR